MEKKFTVQVSFGDCDPAKIVFYPNTFRWMDAAFHNFLRPYGGHEKLCSELQSIGMGIVDISAQFHSPLHDGDCLFIDVSIEKWSLKTVTIAYEGRVGDRLAFCGKEVRCLFMRTKTGMIAGNLTDLQKILEVG